MEFSLLRFVSVASEPVEFDENTNAPQPRWSINAARWVDGGRLSLNQESAGSS
jgi:hypothetical protein